VKTYERSTTSSSITGETTQVETGSDDYSMTQTGVDGLRVYTQFLSGDDTYTITATSNDTADGLDKTITGAGTYSSLNEGTDDGVPFLETVVNGSTTFGLEETGTYVDGNLAITQTGADRYDLLQQFNNPSTAVNGMAGTVDFSPVGAMVTVGIGVPPPTGGAGYGNGRVTVEGVASLLMGGYGSQSHSNARGSEATGLMGLSGGWVDSGAGLADGYAGLGHQLALEYCFAAGTKVLMADGAFKAIETIEAGEKVMAVSDRDPMGDAEPREVVRTFHNAPNELLELYLVPRDEAIGVGVAREAMAADTRGASGIAMGTLMAAPTTTASTTVIRTTLKHPFYVIGRGWIEAESLEPGDQLRTPEGGTAEVTGVRLTGTVEPVYNLEVAGHHTYFVATDDEQKTVLVHNESFKLFGQEWVMPWDENAAGFWDTLDAYGDAATVAAAGTASGAAAGAVTGAASGAVIGAGVGAVGAGVGAVPGAAAGATAGATAGGIAGGITGFIGAMFSETASEAAVGGLRNGAVAGIGGAAGTAVKGAAIGTQVAVGVIAGSGAEATVQSVEKGAGVREDYDPGAIAINGAASGAAPPLAKILQKGMAALRDMGRWAASKWPRNSPSLPTGTSPKATIVTPAPVSRGQRLDEYYNRLRQQSPSANADEALERISRTLDDVEDDISGIPRGNPPPPPSMPDGRMYPPQADNIVRHGDGSITARTRGHTIEIGSDGSVTMTNRQTGNLDFYQPGRER
jgi:hypothetical protein